MQGQVIGSYRLVQKIGAGGMGTVWLGEHTLLGRRAAVKVLLPQLSSNASMVQRFFNEARVVTSIGDPGIVQIFDFGVHDDGCAFIVMELLDGESLNARLRRIGRLSLIDTVRLMRQIAVSLHAAHQKGVVHRDLKPDNLFIVGDPAVTGGERPKVLDFGIAKFTSEDNKLKTQTGTLMGTPVYMSPEQCRGTGSVDHRSDVYSLGCVIFSALTGRPPFDLEGDGEFIIAHVRDTPPTPSSLLPTLPPEIDHITMRCLAKDPNARYQTMLELAADLGNVEAAIHASPHASHVSAPMPMPTPMSSQPTTLSSSVGQHMPFVEKRRPWGRVALISLIAAGGIAAGVVVISNKSSSKSDSVAPAATPAAAPTTPAVAPAPPPTPAPEPPPPAPVATPDPIPTPPPTPAVETPATEKPAAVTKKKPRPKPKTKEKTDDGLVDRGD